MAWSRLSSSRYLLVPLIPRDNWLSTVPPRPRLPPVGGPNVGGNVYSALWRGCGFAGYGGRDDLAVVTARSLCESEALHATGLRHHWNEAGLHRPVHLSPLRPYADHTPCCAGRRCSQLLPVTKQRMIAAVDLHKGVAVRPRPCKWTAFAGFTVCIAAPHMLSSGDFSQTQDSASQQLPAVGLTGLSGTRTFDTRSPRMGSPHCAA
ncbi:hypothetical protein DAEQUDRAFT_359934 [Daedalea quercina L-15889]|uniref:Uncharacterized protein n=1 Tax=Daedalea quercina L-15889 TaxID=1314783 RepID=A0A165TSU2_9APHY|nr:hypothetical protein DAEQUDRAFT_359934 [Daedalea quercina L-15889]